MQTQHVSRDDQHDHGTGAVGGLFSHPTTDHLDTSPASRPDGERSYTDLFREPADAPENSGETA